MQLELIDTNATSWQQELDTLYLCLGGSGNSTLLPYHFLLAAFPHIGGRVVRVSLEEQTVLFVFLLPYPAVQENEIFQGTAQGTTHRRIAESGQEIGGDATDLGKPLYVARYHRVQNVSTAALPDLTRLQLTLAALIGVDAGTITLYDPTASHMYAATARQVGAVEIGRPSAAEAATIRRLQQSIWGSPPEFLYPIDLHSVEFPLGTSLVARVDGEVAGFLFGFYKAGGPPLPGDWHTQLQGDREGDLRLESQVMGVLPAHRGLRIGYLLKRIQAEQAMRDGIGVIHWTVDPLQYPNAALNFGLLRAVAFTFTPDYYPFRNELNRGPASRFSLTWMIHSARVQAIPLHDARSTILHLDHHPEIVQVNEGWQQLDFSAQAPMMAIEIPATWTQLQQHAPEEATAWRAATDRLFSHYIGSEPGKYVVTDVGVATDRRYLIIQQVSAYLWQRLEET